MYCVTKFCITLVPVLRFYLYTLYKYSLIVYYELITFLCTYKLDVSYLCIIFINYYYNTYFIVKTHFVLCLLLSNDKFYINFGGSLEY